MGRPDLTILCGGEALPRDLAEQLVQRGAVVWNLYGPTETTIWSAALRVEYVQRPIPIGHPIANTQLYVLDQNFQPAPIGVVGDLYIGGDGLARGYWNRPELTAERFVPNPFNDCRLQIADCRLGDDDPTIYNLQSTIYNSARLYKTGDRACFLPDGTLRFEGRSDQQIKLRGFRIELGEIESALRQHPQVREAVALVREDAPGDKRLVAYIVPTNDQRPTTNDEWPTIDHQPPTTVRARYIVPQQGDKETEQSTIYNLQSTTPEVPSSILHPPSSELRAFLGDKLPGYMIPSAFVLLEALPLTPNGKIDRRALPMPDQARPELQEGFVAPRNPYEARIVDMWASLLRLERVGVHDNFFALGGHSLLATQMILRMRSAFQVDFSFHSLFETPTVAGMAAMVAQRQGQPADTPRWESPSLIDHEGLHPDQLDQLSDEDIDRLLKSLLITEDLV